MRVVPGAAVLAGEDVHRHGRFLDVHIRNAAVRVSGVLQSEQQGSMTCYVDMQCLRQSVGIEARTHAGSLQVAILSLAEGLFT